MGQIVRLTESQLVKLIKKVIKEEEYSEEDLMYTHPVNGQLCKIKVAKNKFNDIDHHKYQGVLVCERWGKEMIILELPATGSSFERVKNMICSRIERTFEILDEMLEGEDEPVNESISTNRWDVIEKPLSCDITDGSEGF
jgi:superfamily II helicase